MAFTHTGVFLVTSSDGAPRSTHEELTSAIAAAEALDSEILPAYIIPVTRVTEVP
jgi:hypothetical protein